MNVGEQLITEITGLISETTSIDVEQTRSILSTIVSKYYVQKVEPTETHPDLKDKIQMFLAGKRLDGLSPITLRGYELELKIFADHVKKKTQDITTANIRVYLSQFDNLKKSSIGKKLSILKSFFAWLTGEELLQRNPTSKLKSPKQEKRLPRSLTIAELEMLREACKTVRQRAFIEVLYATGCRLAEIQGMNRDQINQQSMSTLVIGKGNKQREVYFSFRALYHLNKYLESRKDDNESLFVSMRKPYRRLTHRAIQKEIKKIAKTANLDGKVSPHVLRHTFATLTLNNGAELVAVQELLGHTSPETTLKYAKISEDRKREQHRRYLIQ